MALKVSDNPPLMNEPLDRAFCPGRMWMVAHTRSRQEKAFAWDLHRAGVLYFLPLLSRSVFSGGRWRKHMVPLFGGYVFFSGSAQDRYKALQTNRLATVFDVVDPDALSRELKGIYQALLCGQELAFYPELQVGKRCRVTDGPMKGVEGEIVEHEGTKLVLRVQVLAQAVMLDIAPELLETL